MSEHDKHSQPIKAFLTSYTLLGLVLFFLFDCGLRLADRTFAFFDPYASSNRSLVWWAVNHFIEEKEKPDIVLLGSSLMMVAHHAGDATLLEKNQNEVFHHRSSCVEMDLKERLKREVRAFSFSIAGQMASDAYIIASSLLRGERKPEAIVYGIAPRDLMDNTLPSPASTETYKFATGFADLSSIESSARTQASEFVDLAFSKMLYSLARRDDLIALQHQLLRNALYPNLPKADRDTIHCPWKLRHLALLQFPEDCGSNELIVAPYGTHYEPYKDNSDEYRKRYARIKTSTYQSQLGFLKRLISYCESEGIQLFVVNMPLTPDNVALMPEGFYSQYLNQLDALCAGGHAQFINLNRPENFPRVCFADSVHLNGLGGVTFFKLLSNELAQHKRIAGMGRPL